MRIPPHSSRGFSLIELLAVTAIIAILIGMIGSAAFAARQQAYRAQAQTELRELANAIRSYWITYGAWPPELQGFNNPEAFVPMDKKLMESLLGKTGTAKGANTRGLVFLRLTDRHFGIDNSGRPDMYLDPWGNAYQLAFSAGAVDRTTRYRTAVTFPMRDRYANP